MSDLLDDILTPKDGEEKIELTEQQKLNILTEWNSRAENPPSIYELIKLAFDVKEDGRSKYGKAIKAYLASRDLKALPKTIFIKKGPVTLTKEQEEYVIKNAEKEKAVEMARVLFKNPSLQNLSGETRAVLEFIKSKNINNTYTDPDDIPTADYRPPSTIDRVYARIKRYTIAEWDINKLAPSQRKNITSLMGYMRTHRFAHQMNSYDKLADRILFESSFVKFTYDKPDLTEEDVDQYIILSTEIVMSASIQITINQLQTEQDENLVNEGKLSANLVEAVKTAREQYNSSVVRQQKLFAALTEGRAIRLKEKIGSNSSLLNVIGLWREESTRIKLIAIAEMRKARLEAEIDNLSSMEDIKARILGIDKNELLNG